MWAGGKGGKCAGQYEGKACSSDVTFLPKEVEFDLFGAGQGKSDRGSGKGCDQTAEDCSDLPNANKFNSRQFVFVIDF